MLDAVLNSSSSNLKTSLSYVMCHPKLAECHWIVKYNLQHRMQSFTLCWSWPWCDQGFSLHFISQVTAVKICSPAYTTDKVLWKWQCSIKAMINRVFPVEQSSQPLTPTKHVKDSGRTRETMPSSAQTTPRDLFDKWYKQKVLTGSMWWV